MGERNLIGRCGLYCGICEIYRAYKDSRDLQKALAKKHGCLPQEVRCEGCQALDACAWSHEGEWGRNCKIVKCLNTKGLTFCYECGEYPLCPKHAEFAKVCAPLGIDLVENLRAIQEGHAEEWLSEQETRWRCPACGNPRIASYDFDACHWCGAKLRESRS
jgi:hypothetical protein